MIVRLITGVGFLVLAVIIFVIGNAGLSTGALALMLVLLIMGIALILSAYFQPSLSEKKPSGRAHVESFFAAFK